MKVKILHDHQQFVHLSVSTTAEREWFLSIVYASPNSTKRKFLWDDLKRTQREGPWCTIGDFNVVLHSEERALPRQVSSQFADWVNEEGLIDIGFTGP